MNKTLLLLKASIGPLDYAEFDAAPNKQPAVTEKPSDPWYEAATEIAAIEKRRRKNKKRLEDQRRERNNK